MLTRPYPCRVPTLLLPRYWGAHLLGIAAVAAAVYLGLWQLNVWEAARAAEARDLSNAQPLPLEDVMSGDSSFPGEFLGQPVSFTGEWLGEGTVYVADRELDGERGYWVVTPVLVGNSAMPVVRGWSAERNAETPTGRVEVAGWLQASEGSGAVDDDPGDNVIPEMRIASLVQHVEADLYSGYVVARVGQEATGEATGDPAGDLSEASSTASPAFAALAPVTPDSVPEVSSGTSLRNLLYAIQWWIFGVFALYVWQRWARDTLEALDQAGQVASST